MKNPFAYGSVVDADAFCNRKKELADLLRAMEGGERVFMYGERRLGKTSLAKLMLSKLSPKDYLVAYVDLWTTDSEASFIAAFASAITEAATTVPQKMLEFSRSFFTRLAPSVTVDAEGKPSVNFGMVPRAEIIPTLAEILAAPEKIAEKQKKQVVIVVDEFQQLLEYEDDLVERHLRSALQHQKKVSYAFLGSRKHLIRKMVLDKSRPLYRAGMHYSLGPIVEEDWRDFIKNRFEKSNKKISDEQIHSICTLTQGHPFYTQHFCHALWELAEDNTAVTAGLIDQARDLLLTREDYAYSMLWDSLALSQRRLLEGLAMEPPGAKIFAGDFIDKYELRSPSTAQRAIKALVDRDLVDQEGSSFLIVDRFFKLWVQRKHD